ncbi:uncharacterized protein STAUR_4094 [Stigmatella aurantiaca DW4/3-1]|uniref:Uncharacterized protein n=1 Tax=Stigmatella aurantiaca (strain DW4/3-1) TaxID=378806 RepID=E3FMU7_STIAD|nr:uncharacterized protein STAUR_4094 [Stigmatella aurantiaca DW4/3-1]
MPRQGMARAHHGLILDGDLFPIHPRLGAGIDRPLLCIGHRNVDGREAERLDRLAWTARVTRVARGPRRPCGPRRSRVPRTRPQPKRSQRSPPL